MIHVAGTYLNVLLRFSGAVTSYTGTLYTSTNAGLTFGATGVSVTCSAGPSTDQVLAQCSTATLAAGTVAYVQLAGTVGGVTETQRSLARTIDVAINTRLAPATVGNTINVDGSGRVDVGAVSGAANTASGLAAISLAYYADAYISANAVRWGGVVVGGMPATAAAVWDYLATAATTAGSLGKRIADFLGGGSKVAATVAANDLADLQAARAAKIDSVTEARLTKLDVTGGLANTTNASLFKADVSGLATQTSVNGLATALAALANQTDTSLAVPAQIVVPAAGTLAHRIDVLTVDADAANAPVDMTGVTLTAFNAAGVDRSGRLSASSHPATGRYFWTYTSTAGDAEEPITFEFVGTKAGDGTWRNVAAAQVVNAAIEKYTAADRARDNAAAAQVAAIPTNPLLATAYTAPDNAGIAAVKAKTDNLPALPAARGDVPSAAANASAVAALPAWATWHTAAQQTQDVQQLAGLMGDTIAAVGTRASQAALNAVAGSVTTVGGNVEALIGRLTDERAGKLDHLDADVSEAIAAGDAATQAAMDAEVAASDALEAIANLDNVGGGPSIDVEMSVIGGGK